MFSFWFQLENKTLMNLVKFINKISRKESVYLIEFIGKINLFNKRPSEHYIRLLMNLPSSNTSQQFRNRMDQTNDLSLWPILQRISKKFLPLIDRFYIFNKGKSALLFCKDGKVYGFGQNIHGMLGTHRNDFCSRYLDIIRFHCFHCYPILNEPKEIVKLRFQNIVSISRGEKHIMALTEIGDLYGWGANHSGQLGIGWFRTCSLEPTLILHDVRKVCCGPKHTVALIFDGSIRMWGKFPGHNQNYTPDRLIRAPGSMLDLISTKFLTIAFNNCFDDDDRGAFYAWGDLKHFGLSESSTVRLTYKRCDYNKISKIVSIGSNKFLVLTNDGRVSIISIQNERVRSIKNPFKMIKSVDFCTDVPEDPNMAVLMDQNGECFVWDDRKPVGENLQQTNLSSIADVACLYSSAFTPHITKLPSELIQNDFEETRPSNKLPTILRFNDPTFSDLIFKFSHYHQKPIYVHKIILSDHSEHFSLLLRSKPIVENKSSVILIEDNSYISMFYYLRHIYTKQVEFEKFDRLLLMEIYDISIKYFDQLLSDKIVDHLYSLERIDQTATMVR